MSLVMDHPLQLPWWRQSRWRRPGLAVLGGALLVGAAVFALGPADRRLRLRMIDVTVATVEQGTYHDFIALRGNVVPHDTIVLDALEGGRVDRVLAQAGDTVTEGQPLVELSNTQLELDVLDREGRLVQSITQLQAYETQLEQNRVGNLKSLVAIDYDIARLQKQISRRGALVARQLESQESRDLMQDDLDRAVKLKPLQEDSNRRQEELRTRQLPQIHAQLEKLQRDLAITHSKLDNLTVRAPAAGLLTALDLTVGENRNRGERLGQITPDTGNKLTARIDEYYLGRLHTGQSATVEIDGASWALSVTRVVPQVKDGSFTVDLAFRGPPPPGLLPGQSLQGRIALGRDEPALTLASGAFLERSGGDYAFVVAPEGGSAQRRRIRLGRRNAEQVEVLEGLSAGDRVIVSDYEGLERIDRLELTQ
jgi:HlyD family secretion protein